MKMERIIIAFIATAGIIFSTVAAAEFTCESIKDKATRTSCGKDDFTCEKIKDKATRKSCKDVRAAKETANQPTKSTKEKSLFLPVTENFTLPPVLPKKFRGHNLGEIVSIAQSKLPILEKQKFETTEEFGNRLAKIDTLILPLSTAKTYAFTQEAKAHYNADSGLVFTGFGLGSKDTVEDADIMIFYNSKVTGSYVATNSYGATIDVTKKTSREFDLTFNKAEASKFFDDKLNERFNASPPLTTNISCGINFQMPVDEARQELDHLAILYVVNLKKNLLETESEVFEPELKDPEEKTNITYKLPVIISGIYVYSLETGKIFASFSGIENTLPFQCR